MEFIRTPDDRFENLPDYPFHPNYIEIQSLRIHYLDEGSQTGKPILLLHGEPSWSYLYRKMIPNLVEKGYRVIAPDLLGFGRSDKLRKQSDYSYQLQVDIMTELVNKLELKDIAIFVQDWGGLIGLRVVANLNDKISHIMAGNTGFAHAGGVYGLLGHYLFKQRVKKRGYVSREMLQKRTSFTNWVAYSQTIEELNIGELIQGATITKLTDEEIVAYDAPYPDDTYKAATRIMPMLVTSQLRKNHEIWNSVFKKWQKPFLTCFSDKDPITRGNEKEFIEQIPGAQNVNHIKIENAGHFLREDKGDELAIRLDEFIKTSM